MGLTKMKSYFDMRIRIKQPFPLEILPKNLRKINKEKAGKQINCGNLSAAGAKSMCLLGLCASLKFSLIQRGWKRSKKDVRNTRPRLSITQSYISGDSQLHHSPCQLEVTCSQKPVIAQQQKYLGKQT